MNLRAVCVLVAGVGLSACAATPPASGPSIAVSAAGTSDAVQWTIAATLADCVGVAPMKCLRYRDRPGGPWLNFHGQIEGFEFRPGHEVDLLVRFITVERPPADGSSRRVVAVKELNRRPVAVSASLPAVLSAQSWQVSDLPGRVLDPGARLTLRFDESGRAAGHAGVNRYNAAVAADATSLTFKQAVVTRMAGTPEAMALESDFLGRLNRVTAWRADGAQLKLLDSRGAVLVELKSLEASR